MDERDKDFASRKCARCGADLQGVAGTDLCPKCLLEAGLETQPVPGPAGTVVCSASGQNSPGLPQPGEQLGHYRIVRILGQGGMGAAFEAEDLETGRRVALKVLGHTLDSPNARDRFFREGRLAASINHPNSVYVFGTEEIAGTPVIAMELVPGGTLQQRVDAAGPLPPAQAVDYMLQVIAGLDAAQRIGILHRDVKPSNCFIDPDGTVKIGDFGLSISTAVRTEPALTATGIFLGTPAFCSPEQLRGDELNARSDIYSVGATLFYLLTGRTPFEGKDVVQLLATVLEQPVSSPKKFRADIPAGLAKVIVRCLEKQPGERFKNYQELTRALAPYRSEAPTPATLGLRFLAGILDTQILTVIGVIIQFAVFGSLTAAADFMLGGRPGTFLIIAGGFVLGVLYYGVQEGIWGATLGKRICRLRVVTPDKGAPGIGPGFLRALIYAGVPAAPTWIAYILKGNLMISLTGSGAASTLTGLSFYILLALLFCTARRRNGFAAIHDLITDTRVIAGVPIPVRPPLDVSETAPADVETKPTVGPYHILDVLNQAGDVQWLLGYDLHLLRKVWLRVVPPGTAPVPLTLRNISRAGRLRWLTGRRAPEENWDAFEGISGQPLVNLVHTPQSWSRVRYWLHDLAGEISAAEKDGSLPARLSLEQIWITGDGRAKLLDFPAPGLSNLPITGGSVPPIRTGTGSPEQSRRFLSTVAAAALAGDSSATVPDDVQVPLPLHARDFLRSLPELPDAETIVAAIRPLLFRIATVSRARRAAVVGGCIALPLIFGVTSLIGMALLDKWERAYPGLMELSSILQQRSTLRYFGTRIRMPSDRQYSIFIATHYRSLITNQAAWSSPVVQIMVKGDARKFAEQSVASNLSPGEKEIAEAEAALKPYASQKAPADFAKRSSFPFAMIYAVLFVYVAIPAMIAALLFRGGLVLRVANVAFVRRDGARASRLRVFWRALVAWSPFVPALIIYVGLFHAGSATATVATVVFIALLAVLSVALPVRGLPDRFAGTWPVPR